LEEYPLGSHNWEQGLSAVDFITGMTKHQPIMRERFQTVRLNEEEHAWFARLPQRIYMAVVTEDWCTDCLMNLPILAEIASTTPKITMRVFIRNQWPALRAFYGSYNIQSIPVATFLDEKFNLLGHWIERPQAAHLKLVEWKEAHPEIEIIRRRADISADEKRELLAKASASLLDEMRSWYDTGLQSETVREVALLLGVNPHAST
jgi:hypothetical protein